MAEGNFKIEKEFFVPNRQGIHARVAAQIVDVTRKFASEVWISKGGEKVSAKSILDILTLACGYGTKILISIEGPDAKEVLEAIETLFRKKFGET